MFNRRKITVMSIQKSIFSLLICFVRLWAAFREPLNAGLTVVSVLLLCGLSFLIHPFCACQGLCGESPTAAWGEDFTCLPAEPGSKLSQHVMILCVPNTFPAAAAASLHSRCLFRNAGKWVSLLFANFVAFRWESLHLVIHPASDRLLSVDTQVVGSLSIQSRALCLSLVLNHSSSLQSVAAGALQESAVPWGGYFSISVCLPWPGGIPQGVDSVVPSRSRGTSRNSHGLFLSQCKF